MDTTASSETDTAPAVEAPSAAGIAPEAVSETTIETAAATSPRGGGETSLGQGEEKPRRARPNILFIVALIVESLVLVGGLVAGGLVIYSLVKINDSANQQLAGMTAERNRLWGVNKDLNTSLAGMIAEKEAAVRLAARNDVQAKQLEEQVKLLQGEVKKSDAVLSDVNAAKDKLATNYNGLVQSFDAYRGVIECGGKTLNSPDYSTPESLKSALKDYVDLYDGPVQDIKTINIWGDHDITWYNITGKKYYYAFLATFASDADHRNTIYNVHSACFLDSGTPIP